MYKTIVCYYLSELVGTNDIHIQFHVVNKYVKKEHRNQAASEYFQITVYEKGNEHTKFVENSKYILTFYFCWNLWRWSTMMITDNFVFISCEI